MIRVVTCSLLFVAVMLESSAIEKDLHYVVNNGLSNNQIYPNYGLRGAPMRTAAPYNFNKRLAYQNAFQDRVRIQLYYESLCPDCRIFDTHQFKSTVMQLGPYLDINLYPYGNAQTVEHNGKIQFICQHGEKECYGNKLHACAIDYLNNVTMAVFYNSCLMDESQAGKGSDDAAADVCGNSMGINSMPIKQCAKGDRGTQLLKFYGVESKKANFNSVPHILINGVKNNGDRFMQDVCKAFKNPPSACNGML